MRLALALLIFRPPALLLLDEITTHLDAATIRALARALRAFDGAVVLITHDRWFSRVVVEGETLREAAGVDLDDDDDDDEEEEEESDEGSEEGGSGRREKGTTMRVGSGKVQVVEGMQGYVKLVERRLEKRRRAEEAAGR